jgi:uncharacterized membrane protein YphA (DoxX/SURF4 family)
MSGLATASAYVLATVFVVASASKLAAGSRTADIFHALGLPAARVLAWVVPAVELVVAVALVAAPSVGAVAALVVLVAFSVVLARAVASGIGAPCACFGRPRTDPVSVVDLVRNVLLSVLAVAALGAGHPVRPSLTEMAIVGAAVVAGSLLLAVIRWAHAARHSSGW